MHLNFIRTSIELLAIHGLVHKIKFLAATPKLLNESANPSPQKLSSNCLLQCKVLG